MNFPTLNDLDTGHHPQVADAVQAAKDWQAAKEDHPGLSLILAGPNGIGKTHIAQAILWTIVEYPEGLDDIYVPAGRMFTASNLIVELGPTVSEDGRTHPPRIDGLVGRAPIIVIDDLGAQVSMPYIKGDMQAEEIQIRLFLFLEHCMKRTRIDRHWENGSDAEVVADPPSLIITTNLDIAGGKRSEFAQYVGPRVWDRLQLICPVGYIVNMRDVPSYRQKVAGR